MITLSVFRWVPSLAYYRVDRALTETRVRVAQSHRADVQGPAGHKVRSEFRQKLSDKRPSWAAYLSLPGHILNGTKKEEMCTGRLTQGGVSWSGQI